MAQVEILEGTAEDDLAANKLEVEKAKAAQAAPGEVLEGTGATAALPPEAEVSWTSTGLAASIKLPLLVPVELVFFSDKTQRTISRKEEVDVLEFGRLYAGQVDDARTRPEAEFEQRMAFLSCEKMTPGLNEQRFGVIWKKMDGADRLRVVNCVSYFLTSGRRTGR